MSALPTRLCSDQHDVRGGDEGIQQCRGGAQGQANRAGGRRARVYIGMPPAAGARSQPGSSCRSSSSSSCCCSNERRCVQAITQKDDSIRGAEDAIQKAVEAKSKTADEFATIVRECAPHVAQSGRQSYHL